MCGAASVGVELEDAVKFIPLSDAVRGSRHRTREWDIRGGDSLV